LAYFSSLDARSPGKSPVEADDPEMAKVIEPGLIGIMKIVKANDYIIFSRGINNDERSLVNV
jgi:hypothetical protein